MSILETIDKDPELKALKDDLSEAYTTWLLSPLTPEQIYRLYNDDSLREVYFERLREKIEQHFREEMLSQTRRIFEVDFGEVMYPPSEPQRKEIPQMHTHIYTPYNVKELIVP